MPKVAQHAAKDRSAERGPVTLLPDPTPEALWCPIISVDDHALEPLSLFEGRVPSGLSSRVPQVVHEEDIPYWLIDDVLYPITVANGAVGRPMSEWNSAPQRLEDFREGVWNPSVRLRDMDLCGIWSSLNFPSIVWGFAGRRLSAMKDQEAALASIRAYNDWMLEEWCGTDLDRFIPCQLPWLNDPVVAADEIRRNADRGFRAVSFIDNPEVLDLPTIHSDHWDPFFAACEETQTVVNLHIGSSGNTVVPSESTPVDARVALFPVNGMVATVDWIYSRIPLRFPDLDVCMSEAGVSWLPMIKERLRRAHRQVEASTSWKASDPTPEEVLDRNFWFTSIEDPSAFRMLDIIDDRRVMMEVDYPHPDSTWPTVQQMLREQLEHLSGATIRALCYENAARLYRATPPPDHMIASAAVSE